MSNKCCDGYFKFIKSIKKFFKNYHLRKYKYYGSIIKYQYGLDENKKLKYDDTCAICWEDFVVKDKLIIIKNCNHVYHLECFIIFYEKNLDMFCPICMAEL